MKPEISTQEKTTSKSAISGQELKREGLKTISLRDLDGICGGMSGKEEFDIEIPDEAAEQIDTIGRI